jgi:hypothetical protein
MKRRRGSEAGALHKVYELLNGPKLPEHRAEADVLRAIWVTAEGSSCSFQRSGRT